MKNDKIVPGVILVLIGLAVLLANLGYLHFYPENILRLWPVFLIIAGINLVFAHNKTYWATALKIGVVVLGIGLVLFGNFGNRYRFWPGYHFNFNDNDSNNDNDDDNDNWSDSTGVKATGKGAFSEPYKADTKFARLNISGGGTAYYLSDTTNQLFTANTDNKNGWYDFSHHQDDSLYVLDFHMSKHHDIDFDDNHNKTQIRLNPNPVWDIDVKTGAAKLDFDLSKFKVRDVSINGGAASFSVKLGQPLALTNVNISTGVSGVDIYVPKNAACSIETDSGLSGNHFVGFKETGDNNYETPGFASAKNKIHIHISGGLSDFKVKQY